MTEPGTQLPTVVGFVFQDLPGLNDLYLRAVPGLTVLYGLNGAGKTRVLQGIEKAYQGVRGGAQLLIRVPDPQTKPSDWEPAFEEDEWSSPIHNEGEIKANLCRAWDPGSLFADQWPRMNDYYVQDDTFEEVYQSAVWELLDPLEDSHVDPFLGELDAGRAQRMRQEMLGQRLVLITPTGSVDFPSWTVSPAAMEDDDYPAVTEELRRMARTKSWLDAGENPDEVVHPNHGEPLDGDAFILVGSTTPAIGAARGTYHSQTAPFTMSRLGLEPVAFENTNPEELVRESLLRYPEYTSRWFSILGADAARRPQVIYSDSVETGQSNAGAALLRLYEYHSNNLYARVLLDAPELKLTVLPLQQWWAGQPIRWTFGPADLGLDVMSSAESRWSRWAIAHAVQEHELRADDGPKPLTLIDEPERALHRSAEAHMAEQFRTFASENDRQIIVSTHSPELLNLRDVRLLEVRRHADGTSTVSPFTAENREELESLGLLPSDLLRRQRGFVMVEGEHDERLLEHWIGPELKALRLSILNLRGGKNLPRTVESQVLFDFTDSHIFVILDNLRARDLEDTWAEALKLKKKGLPEEALAHLLENVDNKSNEGEWIRQWLSKALETDRESRLTPFSIEVPDIIELLDPGVLVPGASSWSELRAEHEEVPRSGPKKDFKTWLERTKKARFDIPRLLEAATSGPPEIVQGFLHKATSVLENQPRSGVQGRDFSVLLDEGSPNE